MSLAWNLLVRFSIVLAALIALVATTASAQTAPTSGEALFVVSGRGWGHGVGMSQYGAYGQALEGKTHHEILAHYYTGTTLGKAPLSAVKVLIAEGRPAVSISSPAPFTIRGPNGKAHKLPKRAVTIRSNLRFKSGDGLVNGGSPLIVRPAPRRLLSLDGTPFRGTLELHAVNGFVRVINVVQLDAYVQGVVANEMPFGWPEEALEAQAIAARTYALASIVKGKPYHLYSDVRSQVYRGVAGEKPSTNAAVKATAGKVVLYGGKIATTYYFSTSGGKTASAADVFGTPVPYLVSRPDPWDKASPHHKWGPILIGARTLQSKLGVDSRVVDAVGTPTPSGRLKTLTLQTLNGPSNVPAALLRTSLGLRSTWVTIGALRVDRPKGAVVAGTPVTLTGLARGFTSPMLAASKDGRAWAQVGPVVRGGGGAVSVEVTPARTTRYRLEVKGAASPAIVVKVTPA
jgi:SpoIID/LytB domain protein